MRFDLNIRKEVATRLAAVAENMAGWESRPLLDDAERKQIFEAITPFVHTTTRSQLVVAGVDGSGDFPILSYADSFVYLSIAQATSYISDPVSGLKELGPSPPPTIDFTWLPEDDRQLPNNLDASFERLAGRSITDVIRDSDYLNVRTKLTGNRQSVAELAEKLIRPHASDSGNMAIQLRSAAEMGAALRHIETLPNAAYLLTDGTLSLPFVARERESLFYEHIKRLCCVESRLKNVCFLAISKSPGLPGIEVIEELARERRGLVKGSTAEHWYLRLYASTSEGQSTLFNAARRLPPPGAVSYLVRFHRAVPVLRIDMDEKFWISNVSGTDEASTQYREKQIFEDLDYASHDQRCFGYPYPIKAAHDRASLTQAERIALRKQVIDAAVQAGMRRSLFRDASMATGHR